MPIDAVGPQTAPAPRELTSQGDVALEMIDAQARIAREGMDQQEEAFSRLLANAFRGVGQVIDTTG